MPRGRPIRDLTGQVFGTWTVLHVDPEFPKGAGSKVWLCKCNRCGNDRWIPSSSLVNWPVRCDVCAPAITEERRLARMERRKQRYHAAKAAVR